MILFGVKKFLILLLGFALLIELFEIRPCRWLYGRKLISIKSLLISRLPASINRGAVGFLIIFYTVYLLIVCIFVYRALPF